MLLPCLCPLTTTHVQPITEGPRTWNASAKGWEDLISLEAQQRYLLYRAILVAIVSQNFFALVFVGYRTIIARYVAKWGIAQMCLCKIECQGGGVSHSFGGVLTSLKKYRAIWGIAAIVSQYRAIWGHYPVDPNLAN